MKNLKEQNRRKNYVNNILNGFRLYADYKADNSNTIEITFTNELTEAGIYNEISALLTSNGIENTVKIKTGRSKYNKGMKYASIEF